MTESQNALRVASFAVVVLVLWGIPTARPADATIILGEKAELGNGMVQTYADLDSDGTPNAIGVRFSKLMLEGLPTAATDMHHCFDVDDDGTVNSHKECVGGHERILALPEALAERADITFKWLLLNWNGFGHVPPGVYNAPHFDFHFYTMSLEARNAIRPGKCGIVMNCEDFKRATVPVPARYFPAGYTDVGAAEVAMGNHLVDLNMPEFGEPSEFTHTFIYGTYDGDIIFYEPMITQAHFMSQVNSCTEIKLPAAWQTEGYYPTTYCIRYLKAEGAHTVSLEGFVRRKAE